MMSDVLSSASLLLTFITLLYTIWYADIAKAKDIEFAPHLPDRYIDQKLLGDVINKKALPLTIGATILSLIYFPESLIIIRYSSFFIYCGLKNYSYDVVSTSLVVVNITTMLFAYYMWMEVVSLSSKLSNSKK